jgi:hypothetical protein
VGGKNGKAASAQKGAAQKGTLDFSKARVKEPEVEKPKVEKVSSIYTFLTSILQVWSSPSLALLARLATPGSQT